jgi:hypothetical protein
VTGRGRGAAAAAANVSEFVLETKFLALNMVTTDVSCILEDIVTAGAQILYTRYIESQKVPYASRTLSRELVLNASWTSFPLDCREIFALPDDDLVIPPIDEWAGGVLPVRNAEATSLRCSVTPQRDLRKSQTFRRALPSTGSMNQEVKPPPKAVAPIRQAASRTHTRAPAVVVISEAQRITKAFEEARKRTNSAMKAITVDSDFTVIQISEPKSLPPALIVPKLVTKSRPAPKPVATVPAGKPRRPVQIRNEPRKRKQAPVLLEPDLPVFDEEVAAISYSDRFVCAPGVTFKDGTTVKSRPQVINAAQMTRAQYEGYLEEMMRAGS